MHADLPCALSFSPRPRCSEIRLAKYTNSPWCDESLIARQNVPPYRAWRFQVTLNSGD